MIPLLVLPVLLSAQPYMIQGNIEYPGPGMIYLASYYGDRFRIVDSIPAGTGSFHFILDGATAGVYRLVFNEVYRGTLTEYHFVEFIFNREDLTLNVARNESGPLPAFEHSLENQVYLEFMAFQLDYEAKLTEAYRGLFPAMPGDKGYESRVAGYESLQQGRVRFMDSITALYPGLYATRIMNAFRAPVVPGSMTHAQRIDTLKRTFFNHAAIDDPTLLYAPVYTFRIVDFLSLFREDSLSREEQEARFIGAVDQIMVNVSGDTELRSFVVQFLLAGFELLGMEEVQVHLVENYLDESCGSDIAELVTERMEAYRGMAPGKTAPDFVIRDYRGNTCRLSELEHPYTLVLFWASSCVHCRDMIPELKKWYEEENRIGLEVVAISVDSSAAEFDAFMQEMLPPWITSLDPLGWQGRVPEAYHIYATPAMFLLDRERKILSRPSSFRQFQKAVRSLEP
jgi:peroxiredoxin